MKLSISDIVALSLAVAAPASAAIVARVEGEITNAPGTVCLIHHLVRCGTELLLIVVEHRARNLQVR
jgi:hypothetical protein